jgi:hypothetical protein
LGFVEKTRLLYFNLKKTCIAGNDQAMYVAVLSEVSSMKFEKTKLSDGEGNVLIMREKIRQLESVTAEKDTVSDTMKVALFVTAFTNTGTYHRVIQAYRKELDEDSSYNDDYNKVTQFFTKTCNVLAQTNGKAAAEGESDEDAGGVNACFICNSGNHTYVKCPKFKEVSKAVALHIGKGGKGGKGERLKNGVNGGKGGKGNKGGGKGNNNKSNNKGGKGFDGTCFKCNKYGHRAVDCYSNNPSGANNGATGGGQTVVGSVAADMPLSRKMKRQMKQLVNAQVSTIVNKNNNKKMIQEQNKKAKSSVTFDLDEDAVQDDDDDDV